MKVVLTAFGDKMMSEFLDMPEGIGPRIEMMLPLDSSHFFGGHGEVVIENAPRARRAIFEANGLFYLQGGESAAKYVMVDVR